MPQRALVIVLAVLGGIPFASGLAGMLAGPSVLADGAKIPPSVDSEYRFANVFWFAAGPILWWSLRRPAERRDVTRTVLVLASAGGLARLRSLAVVGRPRPEFLGALALELAVMPFVVWWHARATGDAPGARVRPA